MTGNTSWAQISIPIDIDQSDEQVIAEVQRAYDLTQHVEMGKPATPEIRAAIQELASAAVASS